KRMQGMIEDLLAYSRVMTKGGAFEPAPLGDAYADALKNLKIAIRESHAEISSETLPVVNADRIQMSRLFQNLISNAIKFRGGDPPRIRIGCEENDHIWKISVSDNGIGIQPEFSERIFQIFQRLHTRDSYPGSGIGLAVCQRIVERHGGKIWVESEPGNGSVFYFTVPKA
ncbi:MAG: sensor histidine kinase, partial [Spirochaetota bacterium]